MKMKRFYFYTMVLTRKKDSADMLFQNTQKTIIYKNNNE